MRHLPHWSAPAVLLLIASLVSPSANAQDKEHPLKPAIRYTQQCLEKIEAIPGYEATFVKKEVVGNTLVSHRMKMKIRHEPFSVYLHFENPHKGREVLYVEGQNNGNLVAHEPGILSLVGSMELAPTNSTAMSENRYPITMAGIANGVRKLIKQWESETQYGETEVKYFKDVKLEDMTCRVIESSHPQPRRQFNNHKLRLWIDSATGIPVRIQKFGFPKKSGDRPPVIEDYTFLNVKTNVRLTDADFDRNNSRYNF